MKKIINFFILAFCLSSQLVQAETNQDELFKKVFGKKLEKKRVLLPLFFQDKFIGEIESDVEGDLIIGFPSNSLIPNLRKIIIDKEIEKLVSLKKEYLKKEDISFELKFIASELKLNLLAKDELIRPTESLFQESLIPYFASGAKKPAKLSGSINVKVEETINHKRVQKDYFDSNFSSFLNYRGWVLENQTQYSTNRNINRWYRGNTTIVKDDESNAIRYSAGDVSSSAYGYLGSQAIGGISISKEYSITPYKISTPSRSQEFSVESRSVVRYYVNNSLLKTEFLNSGKYSVRDIPLNNGVNRIVVEVEDEFGNKKFFNFVESFSNELLRKDEVKYDLSIGKLSTESNYQKKYTKNSAYTSGYFKKGWSDRFTSGVYLQNNRGSSLLGTENLLATQYGNWGLGLARSKHSSNSGNAYTFNYFISTYSNLINSLHTINFRFEKRDQKFNEGLNFSLGRFMYNSSLAYSVPVFDWASLGVGFNYSKPFSRTYDDKYGLDASITGRIFKSSSMTFYLSNMRDEYKKWNQFFYVFLNFSFDEGYSYVSSFYDSNSQTKRLSYYHDKGESVNSLKVLGSVESSKYTKNGEVDLSYNAPLVEFGLRESIINESKNNYYGKSAFRLLSSINFVSDEEFKVSVSRPITNSFAIVAPDENLKGQKIGLKSNGNRIVEKSGLFNEVTVRDLIPYQYRRLQLDTSKLKEGTSLKEESYIVYPTYKSGHLLLARSSGKIAIKGQLKNDKGQPLGLIVGEVIGENQQAIPFFTNKNGYFFIEGIGPGNLKFLWGDDRPSEINVTIDKDQSGVIDLGKLVVK